MLADNQELDTAPTTEATLQLLTDPTNNAATGTATQMINLWMTNSLAVRLERFIRWEVTDAAAVQWLSNVNYLTTGSPS